MTDLERFVELYKSFGIECIVNSVAEGYVIFLSPYTTKKYTPLFDTISDKFGGYEGVVSTVYFDVLGKFVKQDFE